MRIRGHKRTFVRYNGVMEIKITWEAYKKKILNECDDADKISLIKALIDEVENDISIKSDVGALCKQKRNS